MKAQRANDPDLKEFTLLCSRSFDQVQERILEIEATARNSDFEDERAPLAATSLSHSRDLKNPTPRIG